MSQTKIEIVKPSSYIKSTRIKPIGSGNSEYNLNNKIANIAYSSINQSLQGMKIQVNGIDVDVDLEWEDNYDGKKKPNPCVGIFCYFLQNKQIKFTDQVIFTRNADYNKSLNMYSAGFDYSSLLPKGLYNNNVPHGRVGYVIQSAKDENSKPLIKFIILSMGEWISDEIKERIKQIYHLDGLKVHIISMKNIKDIF